MKGQFFGNYQPSLMFGHSERKERDSRRSFTQSQKNEIWDRQHGKCVKCHRPLLRSATHYDHKIAWEKGGKTIVSNGQALCTICHSRKTHKDRLKKVDKKRRIKQNPLNPTIRIPKIIMPNIGRI